MALEPILFKDGPRTENGLPIWTEIVALPNNTTKDIGPVKETTLDGGLRPDYRQQALFVGFRGEIIGTITGTDINVDLLGGFQSDLSGAVVVITNLLTALTDATKIRSVVKDINLTPYPYYGFRLTSDADETTKAVKIEVFPPPLGP